VGGDAHLLIKIKTNLQDSGTCEANDYSDALGQKRIEAAGYQQEQQKV